MTNGKIDPLILDRLKRDADLLALVERDGVRLVRVAATGGGEYAGPCPFCPGGGGDDRFRVHPQEGAGGVWFCRHGCSEGRWRDALAYVMRRDGVGFLEAVNRLSGAGVNMSAILPRPKALADGTVDTPARPNQAQRWCERAAAFASACADRLWSDAGARARAYLLGFDLLRDGHQRGLAEATLRAWGIGYHPQETTEPAGAWGLPDGRPIRLPGGISLPWVNEHGEVVGLKLRLAVPKRGKNGKPQRYDAVAGSRFTVFGLDRLHPGSDAALLHLGHPHPEGDRAVLMLTEGEFDCLTLWQEAGDVVDALTLGGAATGAGEAVLGVFARYEHVLAAYDLDANQAGQHGAAKLAARSGRVRQAAMPEWVTASGGNDLNDLHVLGERHPEVGDGIGPGALRDWLTDRYHEVIPPEGGLPEACAVCGGEIARFTPGGEPRCEVHAACA